MFLLHKLIFINYTYGMKRMEKEESQNKILAQPFHMQEVKQLTKYFSLE